MGRTTSTGSCRAFAAGRARRPATALVGFLVAARRTLGAWFGWDAPEKGLGFRVPSVRERLPDDLAAGPRGPELAVLAFRSVFQTHDEWVAETANGTVHALVHVGWVRGDDGVYRAQATVLVRPNGRTRPAVHGAASRRSGATIVYPRMLRAIGRRWQVGPA